MTIATGTRVRTNFVEGTLDAALTADVADVTMSSAGLANLPVIDHASTGEYGVVVVGQEIVHVTAHTSGATTATVERAQEGTTVAAHASGGAWLHGPTADDFEGTASSSGSAGLLILEGTESRSGYSNPQTYVTWTAASREDWDGWDAGTPDYFTVPNSGIYHVACWSQWPQGVSVDLIFTLRDADTPAALFPNIREPTDDAYQYAGWLFSVSVYLTAGVQYGVYGYHDTSTTYSTDWRLFVSGPIGGGGGSTLDANHQTGTTYTLALADAGKVVEMDNASANTVTVPANATVAFEVGTVVEIMQYGAGQTSIVADTGVTVRSRNGLNLAGQYASASLRKRATDEWALVGDVTA